MTSTDAMSKCGGLGAAMTFAEVLDGSYRYPSRYFVAEDGICSELVCSDTTEKSVELARSLAESNDSQSPGVAIAYDSALRFQNEEFDAVMVEMQAFGIPAIRCVVALPYLKRDGGELTTYRPKILVIEHMTQYEAGMVFDAFFSWFASSERAYSRWKAAYVG